MESHSPFDQAARSWDDDPARHELATALVQCLTEHVALDEKMVALDFGAGTGLVTLPLAARVGTMVAIDASAAMLDVLNEKARTAGLLIQTHLYDGVEFPELGRNFDLVLCTMVLHHMADPDALLEQFRWWLRPGGWLMVADLEPEDGSFHGDNPTVHHHGFAPTELAGRLQELGWRVELSTRPHCLRKPRPDGREGVYPVFVLLARSGDDGAS